MNSAKSTGFFYCLDLLCLSVQILFVQIDTADEAAERIMEFFNIKDGDTPTSRLINLEDDMRKFVPDFNDITAEKLTPFVEAYLSGELKVRGGGREEGGREKRAATVEIATSTWASCNTHEN